MGLDLKESFAVLMMCHAQGVDTGFDIKNVESGRVDNVEYFYVVYAGKLYICFQGTKDIEDAIDDSKIMATRHGYGFVHSGFLDQAKKVQGKISTLHQGWAKTDIIFCGHSLGGAIAVLLAPEYSSVVTAGQPMVGNQEYIDNKTKDLISYTRIIDKGDLVPELPSNILDYAHNQHKLVEIGYWFWPFGLSIHRHFMSNYWKKLKRYFKES